MEFFRLILNFLSTVKRDQTKDRAKEPSEEVSPDLIFDKDGWAVHPRVLRVPSRRGWYYRKLRTKDGLPTGIVCHYTATGEGTAMVMAVRRRDKKRTDWPKGKRPGSWHFTVAKDGTIIQQLSLKQGGFHAGSASARRLPIGWANFVTVGVEFEGHGDSWPEAQVAAAEWLWKGLVSHCDIAKEHAFYKHSWIDPGRKADPGRLFVEQVEPRLLESAYPIIQ